ncbi:cyclin-D4-1-like [Benincasa hispida]|uniref:cyclin-D4-1-like n=1 Tax=Benincasa hispida TaxID=102211 RepID=UPI00190026DD|nr:cyclin-D4-1-like [Benincasa hispida]
MADSFYCTENANICFDDQFDCNATNNVFEQCSISLPHRRTRDQYVETFLGSALESEERVRRMVEKEIEHLPTHDYLKRMLSGDLDFKFRKEAVDWIWKAHAHYSFGPLSLCLSMNYLDRFLSVYHLPMDKSWTVQLLSVACMSLAAKMEETEVPLPIDLQVEEPKFVFEAKTIQRMELLVLSRLKWKMQAITPFSFIDYFLSKITVEQHIPSLFFSKSSQLILSTIKGIDFLEFKPSEIALAVAISISGEFQAPDMNKAILSFPYMEKERVMKCIELIRDLSLINNVYGNELDGNVVGGSVPQSPVGVLDAACLSYKTEELLTAGSCGNSSSHDSADSKRRRQDRPSSNDDSSPSSPVK